MRNKALQILANKEGLKDKKIYNKLVELYGEMKGTRAIYHYQLGYTPGKLEGIKYELKKLFNISDKEIELFEPEKESENEVKNQNLDTLDSNLDTSNLDSLDSKQNLDEGKTHSVLADIPSDAQEGLKIRDEYPFLNEPNCPDEFKILVADKITAYKNYAKLHAQALEASTEADAEDKIYELATEAIKNWQVNQEIKLELDAYRDTGKVLGDHPLLAGLKLKQEVQEMSEAELVTQRTNAQKSANKYKDNEAKKHLYDYHSKKFELITERLKKDFNRTFEK